MTCLTLYIGFCTIQLTFHENVDDVPEDVDCCGENEDWEEESAHGVNPFQLGVEVDDEGSDHHANTL